MSKILHIGKYYPPYMGGIENFMQLLLPALQKKHHVVALVHHHRATLTATEQNQDNITIIRVPSWGRLLFAPIAPLFPYYLAKTIKTFQPDIIHVHMPNTSAFWLLFHPQARQIPWVIHWHSDVLTPDQKRLLALAYPFYRPFETAMLKRAKAIIATSPDYLNSSETLKPYQYKSRIIPLALNNAEQQKLPHSGVQTDLKWHTESARILAIGRLTYYKGFEYLIEAMRWVHPPCQLFIVGEGEQRKKLQRLIQQYQLSEKVRLTGKLQQASLDYLLQSCDIFCMSSIERTEAFGMVLLQAMSHQKPVVVTKVEGSGMNWVCQKDKTALFAQKKNPQDLARQLNRLLENPSLAKRLGENGFRRYQQLFQINAISEQTSRLYRELLDKPARL